MLTMALVVAVVVAAAMVRVAMLVAAAVAAGTNHRSFTHHYLRLDRPACTVRAAAQVAWLIP